MKEHDSITIEELNALGEDMCILLDLRGEVIHRLGHMPGSIPVERDAVMSCKTKTDLLRLLENNTNAADQCAENNANEADLRAENSAEDAGTRGLADPENVPLILYCSFGILSEEAALHLRDLGFDARSLEKGYGSYLLHVMKEQDNDKIRREEIEKSLRKRFKKSIMSPFAHAVADYQLVEPGDRIAVCISGGKDSMLMAKCFQELKRRNKFPFELLFLVMDPGYTDVTMGMIESNASLLGIPITVFQSDIFDAVYDVEKSPCYLCARMRRGHLYKKAKELGCNKIALGHHYDDVIETTLMSILYSGQVQTMMPKLHSDNFEGMELIRPMYLIREADIKRWRDENGLQFIRCACRFTNTCTPEDSLYFGGIGATETARATGDSGSKRAEAKHLIAELKKTNPYIEQNLFRSMENIHLDAVLGYKKNGDRHFFLDSYSE